MQFLVYRKNAGAFSWDQYPTFREGRLLSWDEKAVFEVHFHPKSRCGLLNVKRTIEKQHRGILNV